MSTLNRGDVLNDMNKFEENPQILDAFMSLVHTATLKLSCFPAEKMLKSLKVHSHVLDHIHRTRTTRRQIPPAMRLIRY